MGEFPVHGVQSADLCVQPRCLLFELPKKRNVWNDNIQSFKFGFVYFFVGRTACMRADFFNAVHQIEEQVQPRMRVVRQDADKALIRA